MGQLIRDQFTKLTVSRQRKYQLRMRLARRCVQCGKPAVHGSRCLKHMVQARERARKKLGLKRRFRSLSYRLQAKKRES